MSEVRRVRNAVAYHVQCPLEVSATARRRMMMLDVELRGLHIVTLSRAPCGRVHHSQMSYRCSALRREEGRGCGGTEERRDG